MKKKWIISAALSSLLMSQLINAAPCGFDQSKNCELKTDILNDKAPSGLFYYAPTNYDHRISGEINIYDVAMVKKGENGALKLLAEIVNANLWRSGEIMTRANLTSPPFNAPTPSEVWTTKATTHGYLEVNVRLPICTASIDGKCQNGTNPAEYNRGLWPAIWMMPTFDDNWPLNGELDIMEAYVHNSAFDITTAALHFNGNDPSCGGNDCRGWGLVVDSHQFPELAYNKPHTWGLEWEKDPVSTRNGYIMTAYIDNQRAWGPLRTDNLPADGANAFNRGFNDPAGGFYLIVNLAVGGPYAGATNPQLQKASMDVNSIKVYQVDGSSSGEMCNPPANINSTYTNDMRSITINWNAPQGGAAVQKYQIKDWQKNVMWQGSDLSFSDKTLPGQPGKYTYYLSSVCANQDSVDVQYDVFISTTQGCNPPTNINAHWTVDHKNIILTWVPPASGSAVQSYEVRDWLSKVLWGGNSLTWTDPTLPGTPGMFTYYVNSVCNGQRSTYVQKDVFLN